MDGAFDGVTILSAGFIGPSRPSPDAAIRVAGQLGIDLTEHQSVVLTRELTADVDLFAVMDPHQRRWLKRYFDVPFKQVVILGDLDPKSIETRRIKDPVDQPDEQFRASYERIDRCLQTLVRVLAEAAEPIPADRRPAF